jgi:hypothetical protein
MAYWKTSFGGLVVASALLITATAGAQTSKGLVAEGRSLVVESGDRRYTEIAVTAGSATSLQNPKDPQRFELVYTAPIGSRDTVATVRFTPEGGSPKTVSVDIVPADGAMGEAYQPVFRALFVLFVVAVLLEAALALVFNWRIFLQIFDSRGAKTLFSFAGALWLVAAFDLDVFARIVQYLWDPNIKSDWMTRILSAMVLAGGSGAVNNLLVALNFRSVRSSAMLEPRPPATMGWLSVRLRRQKALTGPVTLEIKEEGGRYVSLYQFKGHDHRPLWLRGLLRDVLRYPAGGGLAVKPEVPLYVRLAGADESGAPTIFEQGPLSIAKGGMVDIEAYV